VFSTTTTFMSWTRGLGLKVFRDPNPDLDRHQHHFWKLTSWPVSRHHILSNSQIILISRYFTEKRPTRTRTFRFYFFGDMKLLTHSAGEVRSHQFDSNDQSHDYCAFAWTNSLKQPKPVNIKYVMGLCMSHMSTTFDGNISMESLSQLDYLRTR
jgi:hypothetical protein